jgi:hydroxyethylthiazole kinase-like uncharacterized protein yjeF
MKILSAAQTRQLDAATIIEQGLTSAELMERAAQAFAQWLKRRRAPSEAGEILVLVGPGNNGGDGLAVARQLYQSSYAVRVALLPAAKHSDDWQHNRRRLPKGISVTELGSETNLTIPSGCLVIDAMFGTGLSRPLVGPAAAIVQQLNDAQACVVAVDIPSGLFSDAPQPADSPVVRARHTVSFSMPKLAFLLPQNADYVGHWYVEGIGLSASYIEATPSPWFYTDAAAVAGGLPGRPRFAHKGTFGHALLLAGSQGKMGAAVLAAQACLRAGVGLLTVRAPGSGYPILQVSAPEAMALPDPRPDVLSELPELNPYQAVGIGPGLGQHPISLAVLRQLLEASQPSAGQPLTRPLVIDADALNLLGQHRELLDLLPENAILTPHLKEFERLTESARDDYHRLELLRAFSQQYRCLVVLKGAYTCVATPAGELYFNSTGNPGMATGGSGDVLTGVLTALRAHRHLTPFDAVRLGVYAHGRAGDLAAATTGEAGLIAGDIINSLGPALAELVSTPAF